MYKGKIPPFKYISGKIQKRRFKEDMKLIKVIGILMTLALFFSLVPVALAAEDAVPGSFTPANVAPTVTTLEIYSDNACTTVAHNFAPQSWYYAKLTAGDGNTIDDIDHIDVELYYDVAGSNISAPGVGNMQTCGILTWQKAGDLWTIDAGGSTTWEILAANCTRPANMGAASGDWVFVVKPGKVATESPGADQWDVYSIAVDSCTANGTRYNYDNNNRNMLWYGEVSTSDTANFGTVQNDSGFADNTNEIDNIAVNYIANGDYDQRVKSDASWWNAGHTLEAPYDATGACNNQNEFSLMAYDSDVFGSAVQVDTVGVSIDATGTQTDEDGDDILTNTLWLRIALIFSNDTYSGNIVYIIANR
jgi:hypothetical protein